MKKYQTTPISPWWMFALGVGSSLAAQMLFSWVSKEEKPKQSVPAPQ